MAPASRPSRLARSRASSSPPSVPDVQLVPVAVERHGGGAVHGPRRDRLARVQVVAGQLRAGRDPHAVAVAGGRGRRVRPAGLDGRVADRHAEVAGRLRVVPRERDDAAGHRVLREVRVRPLVDVVRDAVAPVLEELGGRPRVVDLVEVHPRRLGEPEHAQAHRGDDQHDQEPQVEAVEAAAALAVERRRAVGADAASRRCAPGTTRSGRRPTTTGGRTTPARGAAWASDPASAAAVAPAPARRDRRRRAPPPRRRAGRPTGATAGLLVPGVGLAARAPAPPRASAGPPGRSWAKAQTNTAVLTSAISVTPNWRADRLADPQPVPDARVVRVDRGQDDVHVEERRHGGDDVDDPPAPRERQRDRREREQREQVALVDARRDGEEREGQDRHADEDRQPVGAARDEERDDDEQQQPEQQRRRRPPPGTGPIDAQLRRVGHGRVEDPAAVGGHALAVDREQRPQVVGVDGHVRVGRGGAEDEAHQRRVHERRGRAERHHRQPERRRQQDRGREARPRPSTRSGSSRSSGAPSRTPTAPARPRSRIRPWATAPGGS